MCVYLRMPVCMCIMYMHNNRGQERASGPLKLKLQAIINHYMGEPNSGLLQEH